MNDQEPESQLLLGTIQQEETKPRKVPSPDEVEATSSAGKGFSRATLAAWGISWPPKKGWRKRLKQEWIRQQVKAQHH
jgi:hypothetical protein